MMIVGIKCNTCRNMSEAVHHTFATNIICDRCGSADLVLMFVSQEMIDDGDDVGVLHRLEVLPDVAKQDPCEKERQDAAARLEARRRYEACGRRPQGHNFGDGGGSMDDYCVNCGITRWDLTNEEQEAAGLS